MPGEEELQEFAHGCASSSGGGGVGPGERPGRGIPARVQSPSSDLEHAEGREIEAEVVLRAHGDDAGGAGEAGGRLDRVADRLGLGGAGAGDGVHQDREGVMA